MVIIVKILSRHETLKSLLLDFTTNVALKSLEDVPARLSHHALHPLEGP